MTRLGVGMGARRATFSGLTGLGDLIVTCSSPHSRNRQLGMAIGQGRTLAEAEAAITMIAEGPNTTREALGLAARMGVELPIASAVAEVLFEGAELLRVVAGLMARTGRSEMEGLGLGE
jgi:glycerol-3-phosphate dehydrogenase (NAD(P)+)